MNEDIQRAKQKIRPVVSKVASVANLTHGRAIAGELGAESVLQVQRGGWRSSLGFRVAYLEERRVHLYSPITLRRSFKLRAFSQTMSSIAHF